MAYCCHCMTKLDSPDMPFCPECGRKHNSHKAESFELPIGTKLSKKRYLVGKCTSSDNLTLTYIGCDLKMDRKVVVKEIYYKNIFSRNTDNNNLNVKYDDKISLDSIMKQISRECIGLSETDSLPNSAKVYNWFSENNTAYIVCEFVSSTSLAMRADELGGYEWEDFYEILKPLLESLSALHEKNIYHKNIKPQNIKIRKKLDGTEELVLTDFGLVRPTEADGFEFSSTPYEPPEQRNRTGSEGEHTDIYSAAAAIYYALTAAEPVDIITKNTDEIFPLLKPYRKSKRIPENVYYALKYALQPDPNNRCKSIDTFITRLETVQKPVTVKSGSSLPKAEPPSAAVPPPTITAAPIIENNPPEERVLNIIDDNPTAAARQSSGLYSGSSGTTPQESAVQSVSNGKDNRNAIIIALSAAVCILLVGVIILTVMLISKSQDTDSRPEKSTSSRAVSSEKTAEKDTSSSEPTVSDDSEFSVSSTEEYPLLPELEEEAAFLNMITKDAVNSYLAEIYYAHWNGQTADQATMHDVCYENNIDDSENYYSRTIDGVTYTFVWVYDDGQGNVRLSGGAYNYSGIPLDGSSYIRDLAEFVKENRNETDVSTEENFSDEQSEIPQEDFSDEQSEEPQEDFSYEQSEEPQEEQL